MFSQNTSAALTPAAESTPDVVNSVSVLTCFLFFLLFSFLPLAVSIPLSHSSPLTPCHSISDPTPFLLLVCSLCVKMVSILSVNTPPTSPTHGCSLHLLMQCFFSECVCDNLNCGWPPELVTHPLKGPRATPHR